MRTFAMLNRAQNTFHHNPRLRGPVSSSVKKLAMTVKTVLTRKLEPPF